MGIRWESARSRCGAAAIFLAVFLAYFPVLRGGFLWDDDAHVTRPGLRSLRGLERIWAEPGATQQYYPVLHTAFWLEHRLWGDAALGYHLLNIMLHATNACLFAWVLLRLGIRSAWLGGLIFALHPVCVESVAWISEQKNTLSTSFYLLAALAYLRFEGDGRSPKVARDLRARDGDAAGQTSVARRSTATYALATFLFILAILTKSVTCTLPAAVLVVLWWRRGRLGWRRDVLPLGPWFVLGGAAGLFTSWIERRYLGAEGADFSWSWIERGLLASRAIWFYLGKLVWPHPLVFIYPRWNLGAHSARPFVFFILAILLVGWLWALARFRSNRGPLAAFLVFAIGLFPALGFFNVYPFVFSYVADHFQYLASLGMIALAAGGWGMWFEGGPPRVAERASVPHPRSRERGYGESLAASAAVVLVALLGLLTWRQCLDYRDAETLYRVTLAKNPDCWLAHYNLGVLLGDRKQGAEAISHYEAALRSRPGLAEAQGNLTALYTEAGRLPEAIAHGREAFRLRPGYAAGACNLAEALRLAGRLDEAAEVCRGGLRLHPEFFALHVSFGLVLAAQDRPAEAAAAYREALRLSPDNPEAHNDLGISLCALGSPSEGAAQFEEALRLKPGYSEARYNLDLLLRAAGEPQKSISMTKENQK